MHVVLLGDSIFDNAAYVAGGPDVVRQLRDKLPADARATLLAVDGSITAGVPSQVQRLPADATHLVVSVGGNDALGEVGFLERPARSVAGVLEELAGMAEEFEANYRGMLRQVLRAGLPTALCTIYYPRFPDRMLQRLSVTALTVFNDAILRAAFQHRLPVLDLRLICNEDADYANPIEPSVQGGEKISGAIVRLLREHDFGSGLSAVVAGGDEVTG